MINQTEDSVMEFLGSGVFNIILLLGIGLLIFFYVVKKAFGKTATGKWKHLTNIANHIGLLSFGLLLIYFWGSAAAILV